jgi:hypothetical protein
MPQPYGYSTENSEEPRFVAEPLFAKTGRGYLKGEGVSTLNKIKANLRRKPAVKTK